MDAIIQQHVDTNPITGGAAMLSDRTMLVHLNVSQPRLTITDKDETSKVLASHNAERDVAKVLKDLYGKDYKPIKTAINELRSFHYHMTSPWLDQGQRILATANFQRYTAGLRSRKDNITALFEDFVADYEQMLERQQRRQNGMFKASDYPTTYELREQFGIKVAYSPVPTANDFRCEVDEIDAEIVKADLLVREQEATRTVMRDTWQRLHEAVSHAASKLADADGIFRDTMIENINALLDILPGLNVDKDPNLDKLADEIRQHVASCSPDRLRKDDVLRRDAAKAADDIVNRMAAFMAALN
jgi:hypothetical protein